MQLLTGTNEGRMQPNSLTAHLKCKDSPVRQFMESTFGATRRVTGPSNKAVRQFETKDPGHTAYSTIGTAIDRRIRLYFPGAAAEEADERRVTVQGAYLLWEMQGWEFGSLSGFFEALEQFGSRIEPGARLVDADEDTLCRFVVNLAWFDQSFRGGPKILENSPLMQCDRPSVDNLLEVVPIEWVEDLRVLSRMFLYAAGDRLHQPCRIGPTFEGSRDVGGADADVILGTSLIDVKTTVDPKVARDCLWQILGYALLDYSDVYGLNAAGFYFARQGRFVEWPLAELARDCSGDAVESWPAARNEFRRMARGLQSL